MTRYYVDISHELMKQIREMTFDGPWPEGFDLLYKISETVHAERWLVEDDGAPEELDHRLVDPVFSRMDNGEVLVTDRRLVL